MIVDYMSYDEYFLILPPRESIPEDKREEIQKFMENAYDILEPIVEQKKRDCEPIDQMIENAWFNLSSRLELIRHKWRIGKGIGIRFSEMEYEDQIILYLIKRTPLAEFLVSGDEIQIKPKEDKWTGMDQK